MDYAKAASTSPSAGRKPYLEPGIEALMVITQAKLIEGGHKGNSYVFEFKILDAKALVPGLVPPVPGAERAYIVDLDNPQYGFANLMGVAEAIEGGKMPGLSEDQMKQMITSGKSTTEVAEADKAAKGDALKTLLSEAVGTQIRVSTTGIKTQAGKDFTANTWSHVPGQTLEGVRAMREKLRAGGI